MWPIGRGKQVAQCLALHQTIIFQARRPSPYLPTSSKSCDKSKPIRTNTRGPGNTPQVQASPISGQRSHMETHFNETTSGIFSPRDMLLPVPLHVPPAQARSTPTLRPGVRGLGRVALPLGIHREQGPRKGLKSALLLQAPTLHQSPSVMEMGFWGILLLVGLFRQSS